MVFRGVKMNKSLDNLSQKQKKQRATYKRDSAKMGESMEIWKENYPDLLFLEPRELFDKAIVGVVERINLTALCYSTQEILNILIQPEFGMSQEDALEYFEFNIRGSYGENSPVFLEKTIQ